MVSMTVTDIVRDDHIFTDRWLEEDETPKKDLGVELEIYNNSKTRFLFYPWGVWVTAYARRNLFTAIFECERDYVYSDTDSVKIINADKHAEYFKRYNDWITNRLKNALVFHGIDESAISPKTITGKAKPLGVWDFDGSYTQFKTLGAKRYLVQYADTGKYELTVSGLNKKVCVPYLLKKYGEKNLFKNFTNRLYIPKGATGKMIHTYIDIPRDGTVKDYRGVKAQYHEETCVHLENADYSLSLSREYVDYYLGIQEE